MTNPTFSGDESSNEVALRMILSKIQEDPQSGSCLNISYSDMTGVNAVIQSIIINVIIVIIMIW